MQINGKSPLKFYLADFFKAICNREHVINFMRALKLLNIQCAVVPIPPQLIMNWNRT